MAKRVAPEKVMRGGRFGVAEARNPSAESVEDGKDLATPPISVTGPARVVLDRLASLREEDETDDYGVLRPTEHAFTTAWELLVGASQEMTAAFPRASVSTDSEGGIRVQWIRPERQVRLVIPSTAGKRQYVYHEEGDRYDIEESVSASALARWLSWLAEHD